jgi:hypothetical protein
VVVIPFAACCCNDMAERANWNRRRTATLGGNRRFAVSLGYRVA